MAFDAGLAQRIRGYIGDRHGVTEKKMFGGIAFMLYGNMCVGIVDDKLMARVGPAAYDQSLEELHVTPMDFTGKLLKGYVYVHPDGLQADAQLARWIDRSLQFVATLPPK